MIEDGGPQELQIYSSSPSLVIRNPILQIQEPGKYGISIRIQPQSEPISEEYRIYVMREEVPWRRYSITVIFE